MKKFGFILIFLSIAVFAVAVIFYVSNIASRITSTSLSGVNSFSEPRNINQPQAEDTDSTDIFQAFAVANEPDTKYLGGLLFSNNFFAVHQDLIYSEGITNDEQNQNFYNGLVFHDINGDNYYDIWILNPTGGTPRMNEYFTLVSDAASKTFITGPELYDIAFYDAQTKILEESDLASCFGSCAWQEKYQWLGSNLLNVYSASWDNVLNEQDKVVEQANLSENYVLDGGIEVIPLPIRKIIAYRFQGKRLRFIETKATDNTHHYWFEIIDPSKENRDQIYITEFNEYYDLFLNDDQDQELEHSCYYLGQYEIVREQGC